MQIKYITPLSNAWKRMIKSLFKPFHINKWFALGFTAFLAGLLDWEGASSHEDTSNHFDFGEVINFPNEAWRWLNDNPDWFSLIVAGCLAIIALVLVLTWLSSRGKFMFLDNVVHDRALIKKPWADYKAIGNSLFLWRIGFGLLCFLIFGAFVSYFYYEIYDMYHQYATDEEMIFASIGMGLFLVLLIIIASYISLFVNDFIIPLMYKNKSRIWIGWGRFMLLFTKHFFHFVIYGLFIFLLYIPVVITIVLLGLLTCCLGFFILIIPYVGSVLLLPISVTFRALSVEFLAQFGEQYNIFPIDNQEPEPAEEG